VPANIGTLERWNIEALLHYPAVALFVQRAEDANPDFDLTEENASTVAAICARLDGLPLAIELVAARTNLLSPQALLERLGTGLDLLAAGPRDLPARQQTLRNAIGWSYNLLDEGEQTLFRRLGVFLGGWTLGAAEAVCNARSDLPTRVLAGMESLLDKSLLQQEDEAQPMATDAPGEELRFGMLETIREYANERLEESGEAEEIRRLHAEYFLALAEAADPKLTGAEQKRWMDELEREHDNLRAALDWATGLSAAPEVGLRLAGALWWFWWVRGYLNEGRARLTAALAQTGPKSATPDAGRAKALLGLGHFVQRQADVDSAQAVYTEALALCEAAGDKLGMADALHGMGIAAGARGDRAGHRALMEQSLALYQELDNTQGIGSSLQELGHSARFEGDFARARTYFEQSLALHRAAGDQRGIARLLNGLGLLTYKQGDYATAQAYYEQSLALCLELGERTGAAVALLNLGQISLASGNDKNAESYLDESLATFKELGAKIYFAYTLVCLGYVARRAGALTNAKARFTESLVLMQKLNDDTGIASCLVGLAGVDAMEGRPTRAAIMLGIVDTIASATDLFSGPITRIEYEYALAATRPQLEEVAFAAAWAEGQPMSLEQAVVFALETS
jgi:tetratricopeptide (TPR) repeat protein